MTPKDSETEVFWRFSVFHRFIHFVMMLTFIGLALTGLPLKYSTAFWAKGLVSLWGGVKGAGIFHRWFAGITFGYFFLHLLWLLYYRFVLRGNLFGPESMVPTKKDFRDLRQHIAYFLGKGEPPSFGRFTYWEKFDYWAVFWGIFFIGGSGLFLWFPEFFSRFLPGIVLNLAYTIHSDEALLAIGFIFVVHLYNAHFRADVFPMDRSIFTGKIEAKEMRKRHPLEWEEMNQHPERKERRRVRKDLLILLLALSVGVGFPSASLGRGMTDEEIMEMQKKLCWRCHRQSNLNSQEGIATSVALCMECHGKKDLEKKVDGKTVSVFVDEKEFGKAIHRRSACIQCHVGMATSLHRSIGVECASCHGYHGEGTAHDPHRRVTCEACHHESKEVTKDPTTGRVILSKMKDGLPIKMTSHRFADFKTKKTCEKCHFDRNPLGAPAAVLPAKSILCMGCHSASLTLNDPVSLVSVLLFLGGIGIMISLWFGGTIGDASFSTHEKISYLSERLWQVFFSRKILTVLKVLAVDVLLLRGILRKSLGRWAIHSLIYLPIFMRFLMGFVLLILSNLFPLSPTVARWLDKNHPTLAFTYDLFGLCVIIGAAAAMASRYRKSSQRLPSRGQDIIVLAFIGGLILTGFLLEGMRIQVTGVPASIAIYAFVGYPLSLLWGLFPFRWEGVYAYGWYIHAILTGMLLVYLPFSKMFHIVISPMVLFVNSLAKER
ncbi:MAG: cytochrome b/b6 domain-containing protein [Thermodesulfobacteriota bacterium]